MPVEYLSGGESPTSEKWNLLFAEANRKLLAALDGKSFYCNTAALDLSALTGKVFCFGSDINRRLYSSNFGSAYNHATYEDAAASGIEISRDEDLRIMTVNSEELFLNSLDNSLEAHTRDGYFLSMPDAIPEKIYKYSVAELVYEGIGFQAVQFPKRYNKFNFFRIHNLNYYAMVFTFEGAETYTIPALGCLCVRRDSVDSGYNSEWEYLWPMEAGDPRFLLSPQPKARSLTRGEGGESFFVSESLLAQMTASNVSNPAILYGWQNSLSTLFGVGGAKWHFDPHVYNDVSGDYCPTYFPNPSDTTQPIGNFFHHKGTVQIGDTETRRTFRGYQTITTDIPEFGITTLADDAITITPSANITAIGTNVLNGWYSANPTAAAGVARVLDNTNRGLTNIVVYSTENLSAQAGTFTFTRETTGQVSILASEDIQLGANFSFHKDTLADALTLNAWGSSTYASTEQDTNSMANTERVLRLTPHGPRINFTQTIEFNGSWFHGASGEINIFSDMYAEPTEAGALQRKGYVQFDGFGWPITPSSFFSTNYSPAFLSPRVPRAYSQLVNFAHPNITNQFRGPDGADFDVTTIGDNYQKTEYAMMNSVFPALYSSTADNAWRTWENPDNLHGGTIRIPLLKEHYNALAQIINSVRRVTPLPFTNIRLRLPSEDPETEDTWHDFPAATFTGVFGTTLCPREMYCAFERNSAAHKLFSGLGVLIRTTNDLPDDYQDARGTLSTLKRQSIDVEDEVLSGSGPPPTSEWTYQARRTFLGPSTQALVSVPVPLNGNSTEWDAEFLWVTIENVKAAVEALGWTFSYTGAFALKRIAVQEMTPAMVYSLPATAEFEFTATVFFPTDPLDLIGYKSKQRTSFEYRDRIASQVDDADGDWKVAVSQPAVVDTNPAGNLLPVGQMFDGVFGDYAIFFFLDLPDEWLLSPGAGQGGSRPSVNAAISGYFRHCLIQNYVSDGIANDSGAFLIPVTWARHAADDVEIPTREETLSIITDGLSPYRDIPLAAEPRSGSTAFGAIEDGDTVISFQPDKLLEIVPLLKNYVSVD